MKAPFASSPPAAQPSLDGPPQDWYSISDWYCVTDPEMARLLNDPAVFRLFRPFFNRETTITAAAMQAKVTVMQMYRQVKRMSDLGLLVVAREEARKGKAIKHYRSVATKFYLPLALLPQATLEEHLLAEDDVWRRRLVRSLVALNPNGMRAQGVYVFRDDLGRTRKVSGPAQGLGQLPEATADGSLLPAVWADWSLVRLSDEDARSLCQEMAALFRRYIVGNDLNQGRAYLVRTALAPLASGDSPPI
jgi:hypothetical protein